MFGHVKLEDLQKLYLEELKDAYDFEHQLLDALPKMEKAANHSELKQAFKKHREETEGQVRRLEKVFQRLGEEPERKTCKGMKGLIAEGDEFIKAKGNNSAIDAALISAAQRVEHYEMATYGTLRTFAQILGREQEAKLLAQNLDEESAADKKLTQLAEGSINLRAAS